MSEYEKKRNEAAEKFQLGIKAMDDDHTWAFKAGSDFGREYQMGVEDTALESIDNHIRQMRTEGIIDMKEMIRALKVISDSLYNKSKDVKS